MCFLKSSNCTVELCNFSNLASKEGSDKGSSEEQAIAFDYCDLLYQNLTQAGQSINIKVYSIICISNICDTDVGIQYFSDKIGVLLEKCLDVLDEFFIEDLIESLNEIIRVFYEEITPYSIAVCEKLSEAYIDIMAQLGESDLDMDNSKEINSANGCVSAICRVVKSIGEQNQDNKKDILLQIEDKVHSLLINSLDNRFQDVHEGILILLTTFLFHSETVSSNLWGVFPKLIDILNYNIEKSCEYGLISPGIMAVMNYMQKDQDTFLNVKMETGETPFYTVVQLTQKCIQDSHDNDDILLHKTGTDLVVGLLENLFGKIDDFFCHIIDLLVIELGKSSQQNSRSMLVQALSMCFTYNATVAFSILEEKGWTENVFGIWFDALPLIRYDFEIKRMVLGLTSIIS